MVLRYSFDHCLAPNTLRPYAGAKTPTGQHRDQMRRIVGLKQGPQALYKLEKCCGLMLGILYLLDSDSLNCLGVEHDGRQRLPS